MTDEATYRELSKLLTKASADALQLLEDEADEDEVCAIALCSDASAMSIDMTANTSEHLEERRQDDPDDPIYYKWSPGEWALEGFATSAFAPAQALLRKLAATTKLAGASERHRDRVFDICVHVLSNLRKAGALGKHIAVFSVSDYSDPEREIAWIAQLNGKKDTDEFKQWIESLEDDED